MNIGWAILKAHSSRSVNIPRKAYHRPKHRNNALPRLPLPHVPFPSLDFASSLAHSASNRSPSAFIKGREYCNRCSQNPGIARVGLTPQSSKKFGIGRIFLFCQYQNFQTPSSLQPSVRRKYHF